MLEIVPKSDSRTGTMASVDLTPYLLSASPPSPGLLLCNLSLVSTSPRSSVFTYRNSSYSQTYTPPQDKDCTLVGRRKGPSQSTMYNDTSESADSSQNLENTPSSTFSRSCSAGSVGSKLRKRVSFADSSGFPLTEVRVMMESSSEPPKFTEEQFSAITRDLSVEEESSDDSSWEPLRVTFLQPAGDFPTFCEKLKTETVFLENASTYGYAVDGAVMVRKTNSRKRVFVRYTNNSWESYTDVDANFRPNFVRYDHDTYQFKFQVPTSSDRTKSIEFAVCADIDGTQHWDSNGGTNYVIAWEPEPGSISSPEGDDSQNNPAALGDLVWCCEDGAMSQPYY